MPRDLVQLHGYAYCEICGTRYHVENKDGEYRTKCNGRYINRCIAFHKQSDYPDIQTDNSIRFHEKQPEVRVVRTDWYGSGGNRVD